MKSSGVNMFWLLLLCLVCWSRWGGGGKNNIIIYLYQKGWKEREKKNKWCVLMNREDFKTEDVQKVGRGGRRLANRVPRCTHREQKVSNQLCVSVWVSVCLSVCLSLALMSQEDYLGGSANLRPGWNDRAGLPVVI